MIKIEVLLSAIIAATECNCIVCASALRNEKNARHGYKQAKKNGKPYQIPWYESNWKAAVSSLLKLETNPAMHLKGAPDVEYHNPRRKQTQNRGAVDTSS